MESKVRGIDIWFTYKLLCSDYILRVRLANAALPT